MFANDGMSNMEDFEIKDSVLKKYKGPGRNVVIPAGVREVSENTFSDFVILNSTLYRYWGSDEDVKIPDGVSEIADLAFRGMQVKSVTIPDSVKVIGKDAFLLCPNLRTVHT